jgi:ABC-type amino acid transport substrate-binding protein
MGFPQGGDIVQSTNPYYHTTYTIVIKSGDELEQIVSLNDPRLKNKRIGIVAGTPPATILATYGLMSMARPYPLVVDTRVDSSARAMIEDLAAGSIDAGILWGPMAGFFTRGTKPPLTTIPLTYETIGPRLDYRIGMGVRQTDQAWKRQLNQLIRENHAAIDAVLISFGVPLLDDNGQIINGERR